MKAITLAAAAAAAAAAAFSSLVAAAASTQNTHAYILRSSPSSPSPQISPDSDVAAAPPTLAAPAARAIIHQRLAPSDRSLVSLGHLLHDNSGDAASAVAQIAAFGRPAPMLFEHVADAPGQNIILVEGLEDGEAAVIRAGFGGADFVLEGSVAAEENEWLVSELLGVGVGDAMRINVKENPEELDRLMTHIDELRRLANSGITETIVLAFPDAANAHTLQKWSSSPALHRRQAGSESVMTETDSDSNAVPSSHMMFAHPDSSDDSDDSSNSSSDPDSLVDVEENTTPNPSTAPFAKTSTPVAACFDTADACVAGTDNCSAHGQCRNRWGAEAGSQACFACHCMMSADGTQWGGDVCHKIDISTPFWLLAGTSLVLVWVVGGAVAMLYSAGEEKLPGVIGAGVPKK